MSKGSPRLDLKLNLSPPAEDSVGENSSPSSYFSSPGGLSPTSPGSSCISELSMGGKAGGGGETEQGGQVLRYSNSPEATSMVLVGCPRCLMYVMLSEEDPKCPKCKSTVLLDFLHGSNKSTKKN